MGVAGAHGVPAPGPHTRDGGFGIGQAGKPPGMHMLHVVCHRLRFLRLRRCIGLGLLLRQLTRMHHHKAHSSGADPPSLILHLHLPDDALPMPASGRFSLRAPRFLHQQGQGGLLLPPRFQFLAHGTGAWD